MTLFIPEENGICFFWLRVGNAAPPSFPQGVKMLVEKGKWLGREAEDEEAMAEVRAGRIPCSKLNILPKIKYLAQN